MYLVPGILDNYNDSFTDVILTVFTGFNPQSLLNLWTANAYFMVFLQPLVRWMTDNIRHSGEEMPTHSGIVVSTLQLLIDTWAGAAQSASDPDLGPLRRWITQQPTPNANPRLHIRAAPEDE